MIVEACFLAAASTGTRTRACFRGFRSGSSASTARPRIGREIVVYPLPQSPARCPSFRRRTRGEGGRIRARAAAAPTSGRCATSRRATILATSTGSSPRGWAGGSCGSARRSEIACSFWRWRTRWRSPSTRPRSSASRGRSRAARDRRCFSCRAARRSGSTPAASRWRPAEASSQRLRILEALARLDPVPLASAPSFPAMRRGDLRWFVS